MMKFKKKFILGLLFLAIIGISTISCVSAGTWPTKIDEWGTTRDNKGYFLSFTLSTNNGLRPLSYEKVYITYKGKTYSEYTNHKGKASKFLKIKGYGKQTIKIRFNGNKEYKSKTIMHAHYFYPTEVTGHSSFRPGKIGLDLFNGQTKYFKTEKLANDFIKKNKKKYAKQILFNKRHNSGG